MERLSLYYPVSPHIVTRGWGVSDELYKQFGFTCHNGIDLAINDGQDVYVPFDCTVSLKGTLPKGSGNFICLLSNASYEFDDGKTCKIELTFMHLKQTLVEEDAQLHAGDRIALGGRKEEKGSTHIHLAPKRVRRGLIGYRDIDRNNADGTFDPTPYWNGKYAKRDI